MSQRQRDLSTTHECEDCGHAYPASHGEERVVGTCIKWLCHPCQDDRKDDAARRAR